MTREIGLAVLDNKDIAMEYGEILIDNIFDSEIIKEIPILNTLTAIYNTGKGVKERHFAKKMLNFVLHLRGLRNASPELDRILVSHRQKLENGDRDLLKETESIIIAIDRLDCEYKAKWKSALYAAYLLSKIDWIIFEDMRSIVERWIESDNGQLLVLHAKTFHKPEVVLNEDGTLSSSGPSLTHMDRCARLAGLGVLHGATTGPNMVEYNITAYGRTLSELILHGFIMTEHKSIGMPVNPYQISVR